MSDDASVNNIKDISLKIMKEKTGTFKVETNRSDKSYPIKSMDLSRDVGAYILKNTNLCYNYSL